MDWLIVSLLWYVILALLGFAFIPITRSLFKDFFDWGYPFAKTIGILAITYTLFVLGILKLSALTQETVLFVFIAFIALNIIIAMKIKYKKLSPLKTSRINAIVVAEEITFLVSFLFWVYVRGQEPSIRGLEKFMDYGFINSVLTSTSFPPKDIWLAGNVINYYYFGHISGAVLTRLSGIASSISYNLILATLFALGITQTFSLAANITWHAFERKIKYALSAGILGSFLVNLSGNLHTIYAFTSGYPNDKPIPFWQILSRFNPDKYWYPNATRFIPFTIHEFPLYSYVVADLHGHVFDIPFVLLTLAVLVTFFINHMDKRPKTLAEYFSIKLPKKIYISNSQLFIILLLGFLTSVHYMTNAFDGAIYLLLSALVFVLLFGILKGFLFTIMLGGAFILFSLPFSLNFDPFATGVGINCAPQFLTNIGRFGPFLFEKGNCQQSPIWMLATLWGFFWFNAIALITWFIQKNKSRQPINAFSLFMLLLFGFGIYLTTLSEFFYIKDIYPSHFRANTMFKLGYQGFIIMGLASSFVFILMKDGLKKMKLLSWVYFVLFIPLFFLVALYPTFAIRSYYGKLDKPVKLNGTQWIPNIYDEYSEIIEYLNTYADREAIILEAPGDSYTDYNVVSSYTGRATVAGWGVHEWLWRGSYDVIAKLLPSIQMIYEEADEKIVKSQLLQHNINYVVIGSNERAKYPNLQEDKFAKLGELVLTTQNGVGKLYRIHY